MKYSYKTKGTCSTNIDFDIENDHIYNVTFTGGCNGNLKAVSKLVEGEKVEDVKRYVKERKLENSIVFLNRYSDMQSFISAMDIMLLPSLYEGLPLVAIEWQINGIQSILSTTISDECIFTNSIQQL